MKSKQANELKQSIEQLKSSIKIYNKEKNNKEIEKHLYDAILKSFEVTVEYFWKKIRVKAQSEGIEVFSPRDAIRAGLEMGIITEAEFWMKIIDIRNLSVHGYFALSKDDTLSEIIKFSKIVKDF